MLNLKILLLRIIKHQAHLYPNVTVVQ
jgi:hypothetical protein